MPARSIVNQGLYLQAETTPGTPATNDMRRYMSMKGNIGWDISKEYFTAAGYKVNTAENILTELGTMDLEVIQDYNAMLPLLSGVLGKPLTTELEVGVAYQHVFNLNARAADALATYTAIWGDPVLALMATAVAFHGMTLSVQRTQLNLSANAILRKPVSGTVPSTGVTEVPMVPLRASTYCAYLDTAWADLGTSKLLNLYSQDLTFSDKLAPDWVVDCGLESYSELLENENIEIRQQMVLGFDATAQAQVNDALDGKMKFVRIEANGPEIEGSTENYKLSVDTAVILNPQGTGKSPVSPAVVVNFDGRVMVDPDSGNTVQVTLVNGLATL